MTQNAAGGGGNSQLVAAASQYFAGESLKPAALNASITIESRLQVVNLRPTVSCESFLPVPVHGRLSPLPPLTLRQSTSSLHLSQNPLRQSWAPGSRSDDHIDLPGTLATARPAAASLPESVAMAMACTDYTPQALVKAEDYKQKLNTSSVEWKRLSAEKDAHVLCALMWDWIDELKVSSG